MKRYLVAAKIMSGLVAASLIGSPIIAYAGASGYVGEVTNVFNDDIESGNGFSWSPENSTLALSDNVNGSVVADNNITITTNNNPVTVSGNIEVSTSDPSTDADLTIDNAHITTSGSISADGDVKIIASTVSADGINGGKDGKGTEGNVVITDSNVTSTDTIAAGNDEQISSHAQGEYGNHNIAINNSNVTAEAKPSSVGTQYPIVAVGGTVTINESHISLPTDGSILNQGYYGTDIYLGEVGRIVTTSSEESYAYKGKAIINVGEKPTIDSTDSTSSDTKDSTNTSSDSTSSDSKDSTNTSSDSTSSDSKGSTNTSSDSTSSDSKNSSSASSDSASSDSKDSTSASSDSAASDKKDSTTPSSDSAASDPKDSSSSSSDSVSSNTNSGTSASSDDNNSSGSIVAATSDYANVYKSDISNGDFAAVSNNSGSATVSVKDSNGKLMTVVVDLTSASTPESNSSNITATIVPALDRNNDSNNELGKSVQALNAVITGSGKTPIEGALFIRAYLAGTSLTKLEKPAKYTFTLDKVYEGKPITVYVRTVTGEVHSYDAVVTNGKVQISTEYLGTVAFAM
ncbi:MAG: hypothetical protein IJU77_02880 [Butyrivibrio sp.]|nr:hypothetical protein [Butyrivibrio sp.]